MGWITMAIAGHTHDFSLPISEAELFQCALQIHEKVLGTKYTGNSISNRSFREL